jgi:hypothetical protein
MLRIIDVSEKMYKFIESFNSYQYWILKENVFSLNNRKHENISIEPRTMWDFPMIFYL